MNAKEKRKRNAAIKELIDAPSCPFTNRLEAAIYMAIRDGDIDLPIGGDQMKLANFSMQLATWIGDLVYVDVDRE